MAVLAHEHEAQTKNDLPLAIRGDGAAADFMADLNVGNIPDPDGFLTPPLDIGPSQTPFVTLFALVPLCVASQDGAAKTELAKLDGTWQVIGHETNGKPSGLTRRRLAAAQRLRSTRQFT